MMKSKKVKIKKTPISIGQIWESTLEHNKYLKILSVHSNYCEVYYTDSVFNCFIIGKNVLRTHFLLKNKH